jgi:tetratricopeptide (TPR) repeat protein
MGLSAVSDERGMMKRVPENRWLALSKRRLVSPILVCALLIQMRFFTPFADAQTAQARPEDTAVQFMQKGAAAMHQGKAGDAEAFFRQAIGAAPEMPDAYLGLGMSELREGKIDDAEHALSQAVELDPKIQGGHMFLGIAQYQMHNMDAAADSLKQELAVQPDNVEVLTWLGIVEIAAGHPDAATGPLDRAAALAPADPNVLDYRGRAHSLVAQQSYRALTALDPDSWRVHRALGEVYSESRDWGNALAQFQMAIEKQPNNSDLYEALGDTYQRLSKFTDASQAYEAELKLSPHNPIALYNLGKIQVQNGDPRLGVSLLRQAADVQAPSAAIDFYLGRGLVDSGHPEEAETWFKKSLDQKPSNFIQQSAYFQLARVYRMLNRDEDARQAADELSRLKKNAAQSGAAEEQ